MLPPISPIVLQAQITPPAGGGSFGLADSTRLESPFGNAMWLDEIRLRMPSADGTSSDATGWASLALELKLGNLNLTKGYVPISLFGKVLNSDELSETQPGKFVWKLPKPLFIPAREFLRPTMYLSPYSGAPASTVTIEYVCRPLPKGTQTPETLQLPWVSWYQTPMLATGSDQVGDQSTPADIYNPWDEELHVQRFLGRLMVQGSNTEEANNMALCSAEINLATGALTVGALVTAQDSYNNILIRDRTPFAHVFDSIDRAWTVNSILPPKGFYLFTFDRYWTNWVGTSRTAALGVSMVGWREVRLRAPRNPNQYDISGPGFTRR